MNNSYVGKNIFDILFEYPVDVGDCTEEVQERLLEEYGCIEYNSIMWMSGDEINEFEINTDAVDWSFGQSIDMEYFYDDLIRESDHYLCFACGVTWNGYDGYKLSGNFIDSILRDYDSNQIIRKISKGKKAIVFTEYSHDVPMGSTTVVISLTDKEYGTLKKASFDKVKSFAEKYMK